MDLVKCELEGESFARNFFDLAGRASTEMKKKCISLILNYQVIAVRHTLHFLPRKLNIFIITIPNDNLLTFCSDTCNQRGGFWGSN